VTDRPLSGKIAWVTGGASGMGRATALALAKAGADVAVGSLVASQRDSVLLNQNCYTPPDENLALTADEIRSHGVRALGIDLDVCSTESVVGSFQAIIDRFGKIDILINAAGTSARSPITGHSDQLWGKILDVNLNGPYRTIKACLPGMVERRWGRIVNFSSTAAHFGHPLYSAYCSSKTGLLGLTRCVALEGAPFGVACNAICPGYVATESCNTALKEEIAIHALDISLEEYKAQIAGGIPQRRFLTPEEVAGLALYLCREDAFGIEGEAITMAMGSSW
jgi:3-hydroxybutyrate dehydrogenase